MGLSEGRWGWSKRILVGGESHAEPEVGMKLACVRNSQEPVWLEQSKRGVWKELRSESSAEAHTCPFLVLHLFPPPLGPCQECRKVTV